MKKRKGDTKTVQKEQIKNPTEPDVRETRTRRSWWGMFKYSLLLLVPGFLNHAALHREADVLKPPGQLYDIGWKQKIFMSCSGRGPPTVILDSPTGQSSDAWTLIEPEIAKVCRVCHYDRAGLGFSERPFVNWSEPQQAKRGKLSTSERMVEDFHRLFTLSSDQPGPFILVGSELGAVNARFYTQMFANDISSVVLINPLVEGMFNEEWKKLWLEQYVSSQQALQFFAATGLTRIALILGLMKTPFQHNLISLNVTLRQKHLLCKPAHLSAAVDEFFFLNESLAQMNTLRKLKPFPQSVDVTIVSSDLFDEKLSRELNQIWSAAQDQISNVLHPGSDRINLSGTAKFALLQHHNTIVNVIKTHLVKWKKKQAKHSKSL